MKILVPPSPLRRPQNGTQAHAPGRERGRKLPAWSGATPFWGFEPLRGHEIENKSVNP